MVVSFIGIYISGLTDVYSLEIMLSRRDPEERSQKAKLYEQLL